MARGMPDEALVALEVSIVRPRPEEAFEDVAHRSGMVERLLDELAIEPALRSTSGIAIGEAREYEDGRSVLRGYSATNRIAVRLRDADAVAVLLRDAVGRAEADVSGPSWLVAHDNPARAGACRAAAIDARRRAEAFADGLGMRVGSIVAAQEPGTRAAEHRHEIAGYSHMLAEQGPVIPVSPGEHEVYATIEVTFALEHR